ncbi:MAG TPA: long-chain-fatty-acid--CoA ligase [Candidatus Binatia bacterium]|jgi:acyl-CoA synthetase (AMP-forming)/AMP-acid ligase II
MLLTEILPRAAAEYPEKLAVCCGTVRMNYREVAESVSRLAGALADLGVKRGDRVALLHRNCHRVLETYFAAVHAGAVLVPLNYRLAAGDLAYILDDTECRILIADSGWRELAEDAARRSKSGVRVLWSHVDGEASADTYGTTIAGASAAPLRDDSGREDDPVNIYYTSGTTGHQKGVVLTHRNIYSHALSTIAELGLSDSDVWAHVAPMFHLADAWATWAITWTGGRHVMAGRFDPPSVLKLIDGEHVTVTNLIPTMLNDLVNSPDAASYGYESLRLVMSGGAPIAPRLVQKIIETFGCEYVQTYGLTETSPYLTFSLLKDHLRKLTPEEQFAYRAKTGRAALGVSLRIVDENGSDVARDGRAVGEILARGDRITPGYWKLPEATAEAISQDWFRTGDLATIDGEGYLNIVDRKKDAIITGGELVYTTEIENALYEHPAILEAAVVGIPDERWGEIVKAAVVLKPAAQASATEIIEHCRARVAHYKCPRIVEFLDALPRTGSGKIYKKALKTKSDAR